MPSSLTWIDHDPTARERALRILSLFQEKESRDASRRRYEKDDYPESEIQTWHPRLPDAPVGFPDDVDQISFELQPDEASFLLDRLLESQ